MYLFMELGTWLCFSGDLFQPTFQIIQLISFRPKAFERKGDHIGPFLHQVGTGASALWKIAVLWHDIVGGDEMMIFLLYWSGGYHVHRCFDESWEFSVYDSTIRIVCYMFLVNFSF